MVTMQRPYSLKNGNLETKNKNDLKQKCMVMSGQRLKLHKACQNPFYISFRVVLCKKKTAPKNTKYSRNETILKIGHHAKTKCKMQNPDFDSKIKIPKNMSKSILQIIKSCSVQKTARKNTEYSRDETILKMDHHAKAIDHGKWSVWVKN